MMQEEKPLKVCLFPGSIGGGGIGIVMLGLAEGLIERGFSVDIIAIGNTPSELGAGRNIPLGVNVINISPRARGALLPLIKYLRRERPAMLISARDYVNLLALAAHRISGLRSRCKLIWTFHTHYTSQLNVSTPLDRIIFSMMMKFMLSVDSRVCVSREIAEDLSIRSNTPRSSYDVIDNPGWSDASAIRSRQACPHKWLKDRHPGMRDSDSPVLIGAGRLVPQKDFETLIRAFSRFRETFQNGKLIILGEGPERVKLLSLISSLGINDSVDMPGHVDNPLAYLSRSDVFVLSSRWEGQPIILIEAIGCSCPIVSTDCPSGPADILDGGLGALVPIGDVSCMVKAIINAVNIKEPHPLDFTSTMYRFSPQRAAEAYLKLIK